MPNPNDNISALYEELNSKGIYDIKDEDYFRDYLSDGENREALRKELESKYNYETGDSAEFSKYLGFDNQDEQQGQGLIGNMTNAMNPANWWQMPQREQTNTDAAPGFDASTYGTTTEQEVDNSGRPTSRQEQRAIVDGDPDAWKFRPITVKDVDGKEQESTYGKVYDQEMKYYQNRVNEYMNTAYLDPDDYKQLGRGAFWDLDKNLERMGIGQNFDDNTRRFFRNNIVMNAVCPMTDELARKLLKECGAAHRDPYNQIREVYYSEEFQKELDKLYKCTGIKKEWLVDNMLRPSLRKVGKEMWHYDISDHIRGLFSKQEHIAKEMEQRKAGISDWEQRVIDADKQTIQDIINYDGSEGGYVPTFEDKEAFEKWWNEKQDEFREQLDNQNWLLEQKKQYWDALNKASWNEKMSGVVKIGGRFNQDTGKYEDVYMNGTGGMYYGDIGKLAAQRDQTNYVKDLKNSKKKPKQLVRESLETMQGDAERMLDDIKREIDAEYDKHAGLNMSAQVRRDDYYNGDIRYRCLKAADRTFRDVRRIIEAADRGFSGNYSEIGEAVRGFMQNVFDADNWDFGLTDLEDSEMMSRVLDKFENGKEMTREEQALLDAKALELAANAYFSKDVSTGYKAGQTTAVSIPFMVEMALNPLAKAGSASVRGVAKWGLKRYGSKAARRAATGFRHTVASKFDDVVGYLYRNSRTRKFGKAIVKGAGDFMGAFGVTATSSMPSVVADANERAAGKVSDFGFDIDSNHNVTIKATGMEKEDISWWGAFKKAFTARMIDNYSEMLGDYFAPALKGFGIGGKLIADSRFGKWVASKSTKHLRFDKVMDFLANSKANQIAKAVMAFEKQARWHGVIGEFAEELAAGVLNAMLVGDQTLDNNKDTGVFNWDNLVDTFWGVALMGGVFSSIKTVSYRTPKYTARNEMRRTAKEGRSIWLDKTRWDEFKAAIDASDDETSKALLAGIMSDVTLSRREREAAGEYAKAALVYRGAVMADQKRREDKEKPEDPNQLAAEEAYENAYENQDPEAAAAAQKAYEKCRAQMAEKFGEENMKDWEQDPLGALQAAVQRGGLSDESRQLALDFVNTKAALDGFNDRKDDDLQDQIDTANAEVDVRTNSKERGGDGNIHPVKLNDGREVEVIGGTVATNEDNTINTEKSDKDLIVRDKQTGKIEFVDSGAVTEVGEVIDAEQLKAQTAEAIRQQQESNQQPEIVPEGGQPVEGQEMTQGENMQTGETPMTEGQPEQPVSGGVVEGQPEQQQQQPGEVTFNGGEQYTYSDNNGQHTVDVLEDIGEGYVEVSIDGGTAMPMQKDRLVGMVAPEQAQQMQTPQGQAQGQPGGVTGQQQQPTQQPTQQSAQQAVQGAPQQSQQGQPENAAAAPFTQPQSAQQPVTEQGQAAPQAGTGVVSDINQEMPKRENGEADYSQTTPERARHYLDNESVYDKEDVDEFVKLKQAAARKRLEEAKKNKPKITEEGSEQAIRNWRAEIEQAQKDVDFWDKVAELGNKPQEQTQTAAPAQGQQQAPTQQQAPGQTQTEGNASAESAQNQPTEQSTGQTTNEGENANNEGQEDSGDVSAREALRREVEGAYEKRKKENLRRRATLLGKKLGVAVRLVESIDEVRNNKVLNRMKIGAKVYGWYDKNTGEVCIYIPNANSAKDIDMTVLHETVGHKGLRGLFNNKWHWDGYDRLCDDVYRMMPRAEKQKYLNYSNIAKIQDKAKRRRAAADEYMARMAETGNFHPGVIQRIKTALKELLRNIGIHLQLTDADVEAMLRQSQRRLEKQGRKAEKKARAAAVEKTAEQVEQNNSGVSSMSDAAGAMDDVMFNEATEDDLEKRLREYAKTEDGMKHGWNEDNIEDIIKETSDLIHALHAALSGDKNYDEFAKKNATVRMDWRDGQMKPVVTWTRNNIEYTYDMSADLLCINNEGIESVLSSPKMIAIIKKIAENDPNPKTGWNSKEYLRLYDTLSQMGFVVPCKGCYDAAGRFKMLPSVAQKFGKLVNEIIDERNKDPEKFDAKVRKMPGKKAPNGFPVTANTKENAIRIAVAADNETEHIDWTEFLSAPRQTNMLNEHGSLFRAWERTGAGRPKDKLLPEPYIGDITTEYATIIGTAGSKTPSFRDILVNVGTSLRRNSHSEFRPYLAVDEIQFMRDAFVRGLMVFKYMKELDDVRLFGKMGVKYNMSFFAAYDKNGTAAGLDANGNYIASEESVGAREFPYTGEDGRTHYDGMKGWEEARKYCSDDVSLSSVILSIPHLIKSMTDVPTPSDPRGLWGSLIPFHSTGATTAQLAAQGLGHARAIDASPDGAHKFTEEAMTDWDKGVTNFEQVQNDRFGEGWEVVEGEKAGEKVTPGHNVEYDDGTHYYNPNVEIDGKKGIHLFKQGYMMDEDYQAYKSKNIPFNRGQEWRVRMAQPGFVKFSIDYNDKVRELNSDYGYKEAADFYIEQMQKLGLIPRFDFEVPEDVFLLACEAAGVDPHHPKLGWKGEGNSWSPIDSEAYYSLFCDYGMTKADGTWSKQRPVGFIDENGERSFRLPDNTIEIAQRGVNAFTERMDTENQMIDDAIRNYTEGAVADGKLTQEQADEILGESSDVSLREGEEEDDDVMFMEDSLNNINGENLSGRNAADSGKRNNFVSATVSPFYSKTVNDPRRGGTPEEQADFLRRETIEEYIIKDGKKEKIRRWPYNEYVNTGVRLATALGLKVNDIKDNVGGWLFESGDNAGQNIQEVSETWEFSFPEDMPIEEARAKADLFACLLGDLAPEAQEAVISSDYVAKDSMEANALEFTIGVKDVDKALEELEKAGFTDFTIDQNTKTIKLDHFIDRDNPEIDEAAKNAFADKVDNLKRIIEQDGNFDGRAEDSKAKVSRLLNPENRRRQYQTWLASAELGGRDGETHRYIQQALQRLDEFQSGKRGGETHLADDQRGVQGEGNQNADGETRVQQGASRGRSEQPVLKYDPKERHDGDTQKFFTGVVNEEIYQDYIKEWEPWVPLDAGQQAALEVWREFDGGFSKHINISIPLFREIQLKKMYALSQYLREGQKLIDLCGSQGDFSKTVASLRPGIKADTVDINEGMKNNFKSTPQVDGVEFKQESVLGDYHDEETGKDYPAYAPEEKGDVVHETMGFQFIMKDREDFINHIVDDLLKEDGVAILEEKIHPESLTEWCYNEAQKDTQFKSVYWTSEDTAKKKVEVLVGMGDNQADETTLVKDLHKRFKYVARYWKSGNFVGYIASNNEENFNKMKELIGDNENEFELKGKREGAADNDEVSFREGSEEQERREVSREERQAMIDRRQELDNQISDIDDEIARLEREREHTAKVFAKAYDLDDAETADRIIRDSEKRAEEIDSRLESLNEQRVKLAAERDAVRNEIAGSFVRPTSAQQRNREAHAQRQWRRASALANEWIDKLKIGDHAKVYGSIDDVPGSEKFSERKRKAKGWFDPETGQIVIVQGNHNSPSDVLQTVLHEAVGHYGMRKLFGKHFDQFLDNVYFGSGLDITDRIDGIKKELKAKGENLSEKELRRKATEEYMARMAEDVDFDRADKSPYEKHWWHQVKKWFMQMLKDYGLKSMGIGASITDNELKYVLWRSYKNMTEPNTRDIFQTAGDVAMQHKLGVGNYAQDKYDRDSIARIKPYVRFVPGNKISSNVLVDVIGKTIDARKGGHSGSYVLVKTKTGYAMIDTEQETKYNQAADVILFDDNKLSQVVSELNNSGREVVIVDENGRTWGDNVAEDEVMFCIGGEIGAESDETAMANLNTAKEMEKDGKDEDAIWIATGWQKGIDGKWRYELPDAEPKAIDPNRVRTIEDIIDAPELFAAYPSLKGYRVVFKKIADAGRVSHKDKLIELDLDYNTTVRIPEDEAKRCKEEARDWALANHASYTRMMNRYFKLVARRGERYLDKEGLKTIVHELQHAIQRIEGFARGGHYHKEAKEFLKEATQGDPTVRYFLNAFGTNSLNNLLNNRGQVMMLLRTNFTDEEDKRTADLLRWRLSQLSEYGYADFVRNAKSLQKKANREGNVRYHNLAGEVEARNSEERLDLTDEQKRTTPLSKTEDVERGKQIVKHYDDEESRSVAFRESDETAEESSVSFREVDDPETLDWLEKTPKVRRLRAMALIDGKLYPPMSVLTDGKLREPTEEGVWEQSDETPFEFTDEQIAAMDALDKKAGSGYVDIIPGKLRYIKDGKTPYDPKTGKGSKGQLKFRLLKDNGDDVWAAYNPYFHTSTSGMNDQFASAWKRPNLVVVEVEIPEDDTKPVYKAEHAKNATGNTPWKSGTVNRQLPKDRQRTVTLSRYAKVVGILDDAQVARDIAKQLKGLDIEVPFNVVTPSLRDELVKLGVKIGAPEKGKAGKAAISAYNAWKAEQDGDVSFREDSGDIFVSNARRAVEGIKQDKATPAQWLAMIQKAGGLKAAEDKWLGLSDWLKGQDKKSLTKDEVLQFIRENQVQVEEVHYSEDGRPRTAYNIEDNPEVSEGMDWLQSEFETLKDEFYESGEPYDEDDIYETDATDYAISRLEERYPGVSNVFNIRATGITGVKLGVTPEEVYDVLGIDYEGKDNEIYSTRLRYTTNGLDNKKEIALVVPTVEPYHGANPEIHFDDERTEGRAIAWVRFGETTTNMSGEIASTRIMDELESKYGSPDAFDKMSDEDLAKRYFANILYRNGMGIDSEKGYINRHFGDRAENIISILNKLIADNAKEERVLVIDEVQSQRHEDARGKGYAKYTKKQIDKLRKEDNDYDDKLREKYGEPFIYAERDEEIQSILTDEEWQTYKAKRDAYLDAVKSNRATSIPAAPFEKNWHELAMKRILRYAAENGYDKVAWTKGAQQAERYDIGGTIDSIYNAGENTKGLTDIDINLNSRYGGIIHLQVDKDGNVKNVYNDSGDVSNSPYIGKNLSDIIGKELTEKVMKLEEGEEVSGEGLRIGGEGMKGFYDKMLPNFMDKYGKKWGVKTKEIELPNVEEAGRMMWSVDVTPEMRDSVMEGQVMFREGDLDEDEDEEVNITPEQMSADEANVIEGSGGDDWKTGDALASHIYALLVNADSSSVGNLVHRTMATRAIVSRLIDIHKKLSGEKAFGKRAEVQVSKAQTEQKKFDKYTVNELVKIARALMEHGRANKLTVHEVSTLLDMIKDGVGAEDITKQARKVVRMMLNKQMRETRDLFFQTLKLKGTKVNAKGVEVQGELDTDGVRMLNAFKSALGLTAENLESRIADCNDRMGDTTDEVKSKNAAVEMQGLMLAKQYMDDIEQSIQDEKSIREEIRQENENYSPNKQGLRGEERKAAKAAHEEFMAETEDLLFDNWTKRIKAYEKLMGGMSEGLRQSIEKAKAWREEQQKRISEIQHNANSDLEGMESSEHDKIPEKKGWRHSIVRFLMNSLATADEMFRDLGWRHSNGQGYLWTRFIGGWRKASDEEFRNRHAAHQIMDAKAREVFKDFTFTWFDGKVGRPVHRKVERWSDLFEVERGMEQVPVEFWDDGKLKTHMLSQGNLLYIYMVNKMRDGRMKLRRMGITEEDVERITEKLDPRFIELADWLQDEFLVQKRNEYNAVHERMFGASMASIDNYFPLKINSRSRGQEEDISMYNNDEHVGGTVTGSIIKRKHNSLPLDLTGADAFDVALGHINEMEHWASFAELSRDLNTLLSYKKFKNRLLHMKSKRFGTGKEYWNNFKNVCAILAGEYRPQKRDNGIDDTLVNVAKGVTAAKIAFRLYTAFKQILSSPAYLSEASLPLLLKNNPLTGSWGKNGAWKWALENLPGFQERWLGRKAGDTRLDDTESDWNWWRKDFVQKLNRWGMSPNAFVDALTVACGAKAIYETKLAQYKKDGFSEDKARELALRDASIAYNETQQSSEAAFVSAAQLDRTAASVAVTVFRNCSMGYQRRFFRALKNLKYRTKKDYKQQSLEFMAKKLMREGLTEEQAAAAAVRAYKRGLYQNVADVAIFGWILQFAWNMGSNLVYYMFGGDDDEKDAIITDAAYHALFGGIEGLASGNVISETGNGIVGLVRGVANGENLYNDRLLPLLSDINNTIEHFKSDWAVGLTDLVNLVVQAEIGVNPQTISDAVVAILDAADGNMDTATEIGFLLMRAAQFPNSQTEKFQLDQLKMTNKGAHGGMDAETLMKKMASYRTKKNAPLFHMLYSEEQKENAADKQQKRFDKLVRGKMGNYSDADIMDWKTDDAYLNDLWTKEINKRVNEWDDSELDMAFEKGGYARKKAGDTVVNRIKKRYEEESDKSAAKNEEVKDTPQTRYESCCSITDMAEDATLNEEEKKAKSQGDEERAVYIKDLKEALNNIKGGLMDVGETDILTGEVVTAEEVLEELRKVRSEALEELGIVVKR